ncbi:MAG: tRNA pseudouridine(55) synthase TruB, partial [Spirochaetota bacterium]|nr:tRNA pseudouridine(55) synthase TruB [Spirochaetota bacterium]
NMDKEYIATYKFGEETETLDPEGKIIAVADIPDLETIKNKISLFTGVIMQMPPDFSAIHINGKRAYKLAASGEKPALTKRPVEILNYNIEKWDSPHLTVRVKCSKGTYIRSLARDLGIACNSRAYVSALTRTEVGKWHVEDSVLPDIFDPEKNIISGKTLFKKINSIDILTVSNIQAEMILKGYSIKRWLGESSSLSDGYVSVFDEKDNFLALIENKSGKSIYKFVQDRRE